MERRGHGWRSLGQDGDRDKHACKRRNVRSGFWRFGCEATGVAGTGHSEAEPAK